jgi:hypothetical protein
VKFFKKIGKYMRSLVEIRDNLIADLKDLQEFSESTDIYTNYDKEDFLKIAELTNRLKINGFTKPEVVWDLPNNQCGKDK